MRHVMRHKDVRNPNYYLFWVSPYGRDLAELPGGNSEREPPDPISNSEVKTFSADGSVGSPHVRVGHRQAYIMKAAVLIDCGFFMSGIYVSHVQAGSH
jgi:hypothetical protein